LAVFVSDIVADYQRTGQQVTLAAHSPLEVELRVSPARRMLHNIMDNALRYGKRCDIHLRVVGSYVEIILDDSGPGIPPEKREEVFKPFSRLDASRNSNTGGVGLGLTIARDVAMAHGGALSLDAAPSGGLRAIIKLPM
jgi:two-component system, OmpR family, osmolarity sensor histidine kinase EnvZ